MRNPEHGPGSKPWYETVNIDTNLILDDVIKLDGDFRLKLKRSENDFLYLDYSKTKKYWISKSDLRNHK